MSIVYFSEILIFRQTMSKMEINRADGSSKIVSGYKYAKPKEGSKKYGNSRYSSSELPSKVDLRKHLTEIEDQGATSSCVANAVAGAYEYLAKWHTGKDYDVSRMFIYYNTRYSEVEDENDIDDNGCFIQDAIESLKEYGACSESTYPFDEEMVNEEPPEEAYSEAEQFLVEDMALVPLELDAWKACLAEGYPIIFGISLYKSFDSHRKKGLVPLPSENEVSRAEHGGHAMLCVGYSDKDKVFIVRNSWGTEWGDNGYCYIPYDYLMNPSLNDADSWIIKQLDNLDFDNEEYWSEDDESVVGDYETELANMSDEDYNEMLEAMGDYPLEYRIALILLNAANSDEDLSEEEYDEISTYMADTIEKLGVEMDAKKILKNASKQIDDEELLEESITLRGDYLSNELLAKIVSDITEIIGVDELSEDEENFVNELTETWQIEYDEEDE